MIFDDGSEIRIMPMSVAARALTGLEGHDFRQQGPWDAIACHDTAMHHPDRPCEETRQLVKQLSAAVFGNDGLTLRLPMDDVSRDEADWRAPRVEQVQHALKWSDGRRRLLVCCHMGISRSSALAVVIAAIRYGVDEAMKLLSPHEHSPNREIIRLGSYLIGLPSLVDRINKFRDGTKASVV